MSKLAVDGAAPLNGVWDALGVSAAPLAADVRVALHDASTAQGSPEDALQGHVGAHHRAALVILGKDEIRRRRLNGVLEIGAK